MTAILKRLLRIVRALQVGCSVALLASVVLPSYGESLSRGARERHTRDHALFASQFKAGDPNAPLLAMDWFSKQGVYFCRVTQSGNVHSARDTGYAIQGGSGISSRFSLDSTNRPLLDATLKALPPSSGKSLPKEREILVSGIRNHEWFERAYDRAKIPPEVETLYELAQAYLGWFIPEVKGSEVARLHSTNFSGKFVALANEADLAVSFGQWGTNGMYSYPPVMEFWTLRNGIRQVCPPFRGVPNVPSSGQAVVISPDGTTVAVAIPSGLYAVDGQSGQLLWRAGPLDQDGYIGTVLAVGDKGRTLYTAGAHVVERWDFRNGRKLGSLGSSDLIVQSLKVSNDGSTLVAGFGRFNALATSFAVWDTGKDEPSLRFSTPHGASVHISPDGRTLVICNWGEKKLELWDWRTGSKSQVPLRVPYASGSLYWMQWSPDGKRLVAYVDTYPASIIVYDAQSWRPLAQWACGRIGEHSEFVLKGDGKLLQWTGAEISGLALTAIDDLTD